MLADSQFYVGVSQKLGPSKRISTCPFWVNAGIGIPETPMILSHRDQIRISFKSTFDAIFCLHLDIIFFQIQTGGSINNETCAVRPILQTAISTKYG